MRRAALATLGVASYLVFLVATMPASFVAARSAAWTGGDVVLTSPEGGAWHGGARATFATLAGPVIVERFQWRLLPEALLRGRLAFDIKATAGGMVGRAELSHTWTGWRVRDLELDGSAAALAEAMPQVAPWRPEGTLRVRARDIAWNDTHLQGDGHAEWRAAAVALSQVKPLGHYRAELHGDGGPARVTVRTLDGPLRIAAQGTFTADGHGAFSGEARADAATARELEPLLNLLGPRRPDGARAIEWRQ